MKTDLVGIAITAVQGCGVLDRPSALDIHPELSRWGTAGKRFALATVVGVRGSAPREPGAAMAVNAAGEVIGSVSGGCVDGTVYELCQEVLGTGQPVLQHFGYSDSDAFAVGLTCGGVIDVFVAAVDPVPENVMAKVLACMASGTSVALARVIAGPDQGATVAVTNDAVFGAAEQRIVDLARELLTQGQTGLFECGTQTIFVQTHLPPRGCWCSGQSIFAAAMVRVGKFLGYHTTVCDARQVFATAARFPEADEVIVDWPHRYLDAVADRLDSRTAVCVLTHDEKFDVPLLQRALQMQLGYMGAMGSRRTHRARLERLRDAGLGTMELSRLRSPIGLDLGGRTAEETALSIAAEIVADRHGATGQRLSQMKGRIHRAGSVVPAGIRCDAPTF